MKDEYKIAKDTEAKFKENNNYRDTNVKCCFSCKHIRHGYEGEIECFLIHQHQSERLNTSYYHDLEHLSICDLYEEG